MKKLAAFFAMATTILTLFSCSKEMIRPEIVTYCFTDEDQQKLLPHYIEGEIFNFGNDERKFEVIKIEQVVIQDFVFGGMGGPNRSYFYYEEKGITLKDYRNQKCYTLFIRRLPINVETARMNIYKKFPSHLILEIRSSDDSNYTDRGYIQTSFNYDAPTITFNNNLYKKVHVVDRTLKFYWQSPNYWEHLGGMFNEAKYTYYDEDYGIVGFDSYDGSQWRLNR